MNVKDGVKIKKDALKRFTINTKRKTTRSKNMVSSAK